MKYKRLATLAALLLCLLAARPSSATGSCRPQAGTVNATAGSELIAVEGEDRITISSATSLTFYAFCQDKQGQSWYAIRYNDRNWLLYLN